MTRFKGCRHCVTCSRLYKHTILSEAWPAGISTPTVYFMLRERQLAFQCAAAAREGAVAWRQHSFSAGRSNELLVQRGRPQLSVAVPTTCGGVDANESAIFMRSVEPSAAPAVVSAADAAAAAAAAAKQSSLQPAHPAPARCRSSSSSSSDDRPPLVTTVTPPQLLEQPAKRSRVSCSPPVAAPAQRPALPGLAARVPPAGAGPSLRGHLVAHRLGENAAPVVIAMPCSAAPSCRGMAAIPAAAPPSWLSRLRGMLTPQSRAC